MKRALALALFSIGCHEPRPMPAVQPCPALPPVVVPKAPSAAAESPAPEPPEEEPKAEPAGARFYPGGDGARTEPRKRYRTAVLLFAPPRSASYDALERIETLSFQPIVCVIDGALQTGTRCGEVMPRSVEVRLTDVGSAYETMKVARATTTFVTDTDEGKVTMAAPYAPACCMYHACIGRTLPYWPVKDANVAFATSRTVLAVWPADAEIALEPRTPASDDPSKHPWKAPHVGARRLREIATADLDGNGARESIVFEEWANDYGLDVFAGSTRLYGFTCGNI